ncbi:MAG TPA: CHAD domain-containing protein [Isosphaeraceae bacterium]|nr:CHAD domain-containing protein [Isosphaeraceae bacterium]
MAPDAPAGEAVRASIRGCARVFKANEAAALGFDVEGVHRMRSAARRLRGELKAFEDLVECHWALPLNGELKWLGAALGEVRDLDVFEERFKVWAGELRPALAKLDCDVNRKRDVARGQLERALKGERYHAILSLLEQAQRCPSLTPEADTPCGKALPPLVEKIWDKLKKDGRALEPDDDDETYHALRKRAKRVRYAAEAVARSIAKRQARAAKRFAREIEHVQDVLGLHQDAVSARATIEAYAAEGSTDSAYLVAIGRLIERVAMVALESRAEFPKAWKQLDRGKLVQWMKR